MQASHIPQRGYSSTNIVSFWLPNLKKEVNQKASKENSNKEKKKPQTSKQVKNQKQRKQTLEKNGKKWRSVCWVGE